MVVEELGDRGLDEQGDLRLREALPDGHERRRRQDRVADPVRATNQDPLHHARPSQLCNKTRVHSFKNPLAPYLTVFARGRPLQSTPCPTRFVTEPGSW